MFVSGKSFIVQSHLLAILCTPSTDGNGGGTGQKYCTSPVYVCPLGKHRFLFVSACQLMGRTGNHLNNIHIIIYMYNNYI